LLFADFQSLVIEKCKLLSFRPPTDNSAEMKSFYEASGGAGDRTIRDAARTK